MTETTRKGYTAEELEHIASQAHELDWHADLARQAAAQARVLENLKVELRAAEMEPHPLEPRANGIERGFLLSQNILTRLLAEEGLA